MSPIDFDVGSFLYSDRLSPGTPVFFFPENQHSQTPIWIGMVDEEPGCVCTTTKYSQLPLWRTLQGPRVSVLISESP